MNEDILKGQWKQLKGDIQRRWGNLTNDQMDKIDGSWTALVGAIQESYGVARDEAEKQLKSWESSKKAA